MPRNKEFDREEVLNKAMMVFRDKGFEATSMQDLVATMGINRFSLYQTFQSKHELFVQALQAYYEKVAVPFYSRLRDSDQGIQAIETTLMELVLRIKSGRSSNGCLLCNTIAELGAKKDKRTTAILDKYLKRVERDFHAALLRAKALGEIPKDADTRERAKVLVGYSTGLLSLAKVLSKKEMRQSVKATIAALK
ncbi:TetR/AcrR family transcriptional regulator [bacterium]|nr:TetR/AcrR family transcriptional regulator [bacterium]MCI0606249.1 TetR/AcrR family transcriptional regulator [bacterium]